MDKILILMGSHKNGEMISDLFSNGYEIKNLDKNDLSELDDNFSLLITDLSSWAQNHEKLKSRKEKENPIFLPYLLVTHTNEVKQRKQDIWEIFDEVISIPITKSVLIARVSVLIQTRSLSLQVNQLMEDKEMLIKEIHHRVKNNLMIIASLLNMQSYYIKDEEAKAYFKESENRAQSMALIHERLYRTGDLQNVELVDYITSLAKDLFGTYVTNPDKVKMEINVENVKLHIDSMIPLGLIINELVTNTLKYAFPEDKTGTLIIKFYKKDNEFFLTVKDDGVGIPKDFDIENSVRFGMQLITNLTHQLDGELEIIKRPGATFNIKFPEREK
ncbi:MAG: sensor histidine kinase [Methanobacteriaceae archaeon]|nr:sensor histidine kinase [Methanobacteriaceae archaeon]